MGSPGRPKGPERKGFPLRLEPPLLEVLERTAKSEIRSVNSLIEQILAEAMRRRGSLRKKDVSDVQE
jgi:hypothetical protein